MGYELVRFVCARECLNSLRWMYVIVGTAMSVLNKETNNHVALPVTIALVNMLFNSLVFGVVLLGTVLRCVPAVVLCAIFKFSPLGPLPRLLRTGPTNSRKEETCVNRPQ